jgi:hypothetical protein
MNFLSGAIQYLHTRSSRPPRLHGPAQPDNARLSPPRLYCARRRARSRHHNATPPRPRRVTPHRLHLHTYRTIAQPNHTRNSAPNHQIRPSPRAP